MTATRAPRQTLVSLECVPGPIRLHARRATNVMTLVRAIRARALVRTRPRPTARRVAMATLAQLTTFVRTESARERQRPARPAINVMMPALAIRARALARTPPNRTALRVTTATPVHSPTLASQGCVPGPIRLLVRHPISVMALARAIRKLAFVRIHRSKTAPHVMTAMLVLRPTRVSQEFAPALIRLRAQRRINVIKRAHAIQARACVRIR